MDKVTDLKGKSVLTADGKTVGTLADLSIDEHTWKIAHIVIDVDPQVASLFGVKKKLLKTPRVKISTDKVEHMADVIKLRENLSHLKVELQ
jgi:sporulation protein YlmC with PRC-barrel domain